MAQQKRVHVGWNKALLKNAQIELTEPRQEVGVLALFYMISALNPSLFKFRIVDYDTKKGVDALAKFLSSTEPGKDSFGFVEFKKTLGTEFDHSFKYLAGIVCWDSTLAIDDEVKDIAGETRRLRVTKPSAKSDYTKFMLISDDEEHNIEVYVLKEYLRDRLELEFKTRTAD